MGSTCPHPQPAAPGPSGFHRKKSDIGCLLCGLQFLLLFLKNNLFIFGCGGSSLLLGLFSNFTEWRLLFSLQWLLLWSTGSQVLRLQSLQHTSSVVAAPSLSSMGLNSCGTRAWLLCGMWDLPGSGMEPVSPVLTRRFLSTEKPAASFCSPRVLSAG